VKLTVLVDNNTLIGKYFCGEPGLSYRIDDGGTKVLFDAGYSDAFIRNARALSIDLLDIDCVVLSHGHLDHTWGLGPLVQLYQKGGRKGNRETRPALVAHPFALATRTFDGRGRIGPRLTSAELAECFRIELTKEPVWITRNLVFLGEIKRTNAFEGKAPIGKIEQNGSQVDDYVIDDSALAYKSPDGLVVITGCSHSGICNIVEYAKDVCSCDRVIDIIGGFHLLSPSPEQLRGTIEYLKTLQPDSVHACHCTDLHSKIAISSAANLKEVGVGLSLEYS
jgi:7,8-dihydropterin-6-yl-methyl-4-(beta-D-ribofuranosyl)aminobenzene 5'-phosphate synthase